MMYLMAKTEKWQLGNRAPVFGTIRPGSRSSEQTECTEFLLHAQHNAGCHETEENADQTPAHFSWGRQDIVHEPGSKRALYITAYVLI